MTLAAFEQTLLALKIYNARNVWVASVNLATLILTTVPIDHVAIDHVAIDHRPD